MSLTNVLGFFFTALLMVLLSTAVVEFPSLALASKLPNGLLFSAEDSSLVFMLLFFLSQMQSSQAKPKVDIQNYLLFNQSI